MALYTTFVVFNAMGKDYDALLKSLLYAGSVWAQPPMP